MPRPAKKKKFNFQTTGPPGLLKKYIMDNFSAVPVNGMLNGHVLFVFIENDRSYTKTIQVLLEKKSVEVAYNTMTNLVNKTIAKYKNLNRDTDKKLLDVICREEFKNRSSTKEQLCPIIPPIPATPGSSSISSSIRRNSSHRRMKRKITVSSSSVSSTSVEKVNELARTVREKDELIRTLHEKIALLEDAARQRKMKIPKK